MTLVVSWIGVDSRKISSLYIASDSRISWGNKVKFDGGQKVFGCKTHPVIVGYCGDFAFPSMVINQLIGLADTGLLFSNTSSNEAKFDVFYKKLREQFETYPSHVDGITTDSIEVLFASRCGETDFLCRKMMWRKSTNAWTKDDIEFSPFSNKLFIIGSGKKEFEDRFGKFMESNEAKTSRAVFQCLCETLENINDTYCGGAPQLAGLYNQRNAQQFGIIHQDKRYLHGVEMNDSEAYNRIEWRNKLFEICDGETKMIKPNAQRQPRSLKKG